MEKYRAADELLPSRVAQGGKRSLSEVNSIIIHTTGYGPGLKRLKDKYADSLGNLNKIALGRIGQDYAKRMANILKYKGHFLIDHLGVIYHFVPIDQTAWHTGSSKRRKLKKAKPFGWWTLRWKSLDLDDPTDLPSWEKGSPNKSSIGIDLLAHGNGALSGFYTEAQYQSLAKLISALCEDVGIPRQREHIVGHEDVDPISRGNTRGGWDPGRFDYDRLLSLINIMAPEEDTTTWEEFPRPNIVKKFEVGIGDSKTNKLEPPASVIGIIEKLFRMLWKK
jgi:hypothetical protein